MRPLSRDEALAEFARLLQQAREPLLLKYGSWPVRVDREAAQLPPKALADLAALRAANPGQTFVPVRIRGAWLFHRAGTARLDFPEFFSVNLTPEDLRLLQEQWSDFSAERWARQTAFTW